MIDVKNLLSDLNLALENKYNISINSILYNEKKLDKTYLIIDIAEYAKIIVDKNNKISILFDEIKSDYKKGLVKKNIVDNHYMLWVSDEIIT